MNGWVVVLWKKWWLKKRYWKKSGCDLNVGRIERYCGGVAKTSSGIAI